MRIGGGVTRATLVSMARNMGNSNIDESLASQLVDRELEANQKHANAEYLEMIEKIQDILTAVEKEKKDLEEENTELDTLLGNQATKLTQLTSEYNKLQDAYDEILQQVDLLSSQNDNLMKEKGKLERNLNDLRDEFNRVHQREIGESEEKIKELSLKVERLVQDNKQLQDQLTSTVNLRNSTEDMNTTAIHQLNETNEKYRAAEEEKDKLRARLDTLFEEKCSLATMLEERVNEMEELKREYKHEFERISLEHANTLKELQTDLKNKEEQWESTKRHSKEANGKEEQDAELEKADMEGLGLDEGDLEAFLPNNDKRVSIFDWLGKESSFNGSERDIVAVQPSTRDIPTPDHHIVEQDIQYLEELEEKDKEITQLREQLAVLREKALKEAKSNPRNEEQVKKLSLDLRHLTEKYDMLSQTSEAQRTQLEKALADLEAAFVQQKLKAQLEAAEKDEEQIRLRKQIKILNYQIKIYEEQITEYNTSAE